MEGQGTASCRCHQTCEESAQGPEAGQTPTGCIPCTLFPCTAISRSALPQCPFTCHKHQVSLLSSIERQLFGCWITAGPESNTIAFAFYCALA